jgi:RNA polymerase sigma-70 factor (ECF subfamily)
MSEQEFTDQLVALHRFMMGFALRLTHDATKAEDLVQDTYVKCLNARELYDPNKGKLITWVGHIMQNRNVDIWRGTDYRGEYQTINMYDAFDIPVYDNSTPETICIGDDLTYQMRQAIHRLKPKYRDVLLLRMDGLDYEEIAEIKQLPLGTIKGQLHRARMMLSLRSKSILN